MSKSPRYTTFAPGELETRLREIAPQAGFSPLARSEDSGRRSVLLKAHAFEVTYPDATTGSCRYERLGAQYHRFHYAYHDHAVLPRQHVFTHLANDRDSLEAKGQELAAACYRDAIEGERRDYFCRAAEPSDGSRKKRPEQYAFSAKAAKDMAGYYTVCQRVVTAIFSRGVAYKTLEQANAAWKQQALPNTVVACCNRLDRCWEMPKYNPLYGEGEMRRDSIPAAPAPAGPRKEEGDDEPETPV